jgi:hypothetical protein
MIIELLTLYYSYKKITDYKYIIYFFETIDKLKKLNKIMMEDEDFHNFIEKLYNSLNEYIIMQNMTT